MSQKKTNSSPSLNSRLAIGKNEKIITVSFMLAGAFAYYCAKILLNILATYYPVVYENDIFNHGVPLVVGVLVFAYLRLAPKVLTWADEVVYEVRKVVWPTQQDLIRMTIGISIILIIAGLILGGFDILFSYIIKYFLN